MTKNQQKQQQNNQKGGSTDTNLSKSKTQSTVHVQKQQEGKTTKVSYTRSEDESRYLKALDDPRRSDIDGVVVPDRFPFPTVPLKGQGRLTLVSNTSGNCAFYWFPTPTGTLIIIGGSTATGQNSMFAVNSSNFFWSHASDAAMSLQNSTTRTVAAGFSLGNDLSFNNVAGAGVATPFIGADVNINQADFVAAGAAASNAQSMATLWSNTANTNLVAPGSVEFKLDQLIDQDILFTTRPVDPTGYAFRSCDAYSGTIGGGYQVVQGGEYFGSVSGLMSGTTRANAGNPKGMMGWVVSFSGLPVSTAFAFIDLYMHVEGDQTQVSVTNCNLVPSISQHRVRKGGNLETLLSSASRTICKLVKPAVQSYVKGAGMGMLAGMIM
jgi:hypothetical protein